VGSGGGGATQRLGFSPFGKEAVAGATRSGLVAGGCGTDDLMWLTAGSIGFNAVCGFSISPALENRGIPENDASITVIQTATSTMAQSFRPPGACFASFCFTPTNESGFGKAGVADFARNTCVVTRAVRRVTTRLAEAGDFGRP
jgi:hypothetical protein